MRKWRRLRIASRRPARACWRVLTFAVAAAASWVLHEPVWAGLRGHRYFALTDLSIQGAGPFLSDEEILAWLGVSETTRIWDLTPTRVLLRLQAHPLIERATVERAFPNHFSIRVRERRPEALALLDELHYVDRHGQVLKKLEPGDDPDYPIVTGLGPDTTPGYRAWAVRRALRLYRLCRRTNCFGGVSEIHLDVQHGIVLYPRAPRVAVSLGWGSWREKLRRAEYVLNLWKGQTHRLARLQLRFRNRVVVELKEPAKKSGPQVRSLSRRQKV